MEWWRNGPMPVPVPFLPLASDKMTEDGDDVGNNKFSVILWNYSAFLTLEKGNEEDETFPSAPRLLRFPPFHAHFAKLFLKLESPLPAEQCGDDEERQGFKKSGSLSLSRSKSQWFQLSLLDYKTSVTERSSPHLRRSHEHKIVAESNK